MKIRMAENLSWLFFVTLLFFAGTLKKSAKSSCEIEYVIDIAIPTKNDHTQAKRSSETIRMKTVSVSENNSLTLQRLLRGENDARASSHF